MPGPVNGPRDAAKAHESFMAEGQKELDRRLSKMKDDRYAAMNKRVEEKNAKEKAAANSKAMKTRTGYTNRAPGAIADLAKKMTKSASDKKTTSGIANTPVGSMPKKKAVPNTKPSQAGSSSGTKGFPPGGGMPPPRPKDLGSSSPKPPPPRPKDLGSSSPKPPPPRPAGLGAKPTPRPKKFKVGGTVNSRGNKGAVSGKKFSGTY